MRDTEQAHDATADPLAHPDEPGAYVGNRPERQAETIRRRAPRRRTDRRELVGIGRPGTGR